MKVEARKLKTTIQKSIKANINCLFILESSNKYFFNIFMRIRLDLT